MSQEPSTRHFSPAELAAFLDQLGDVRSSPELERDTHRIREASPLAPASSPVAAALAPVDPRLGRGAAPRAPALLEPATMLGGGHVIPIGVPKWRARPASSAAAAAKNAQLDAQEVERRPARSEERLCEPAPPAPQHADKPEIPGLTRTKPWRVAFVVAALLSAGLLAALSLGPAPRRPTQTAKVHKPPPLPTVAPLAKPGPLVPSVPPQSAPTSLEAAHTLRPGARHEAVQLLLRGRTRAALDAYRALQAGAPAPAYEQVVRHLERELRSCAQLGTPCGS